MYVLRKLEEKFPVLKIQFFFFSKNKNDFSQYALRYLREGRRGLLVWKHILLYEYKCKIMIFSPTLSFYDPMNYVQVVIKSYMAYIRVPPVSRLITYNDTKAYNTRNRFSEMIFVFSH